MRTFAERLLQCIADRGATQADVARHAGISAASVSDWATGKTQAGHVKAEPLLRAAAYLQVHPLWLLTGIGQRAPAAPSVVMLPAAEPPARYGPGWPFARIDPARLLALSAQERAQLEGAWLYAAQALGFSVATP